MGSSQLGEILAAYKALPPEEQAALRKDAFKVSSSLPWIPNPGPQTTAWESEADEIYYGGQAGGGKSDLGVGLALANHRASLILRRYTDDAKKLAERTMQIIGTREGYNGQEKILRLPGREIRFGGCKDEGDKQRYKGDRRDLMVFDEIPDFLESQYTFIIGWNGSAYEGQRSRIVCTGNPPTTPEGMWVLRRWGAWLDPDHPKYPTPEGVLRWYSTVDDEEKEFDGPHTGIFGSDGKEILARSRTFIRAALSDNPDLSATNYDATLAAMPKEFRDAYREGKFDAALRDKPHQMIPSSWIRAAQERWKPTPPVGVPMCCVAMDASGGGDDPMVINSRHDGWFDKPKIIPGEDIPRDSAGTFAAGMVIARRRDQARIVIDLGGGYGNSAYEHLKTNIEQGDDPIQKVVGHKGSAQSTARTKDQMFGFANKRTEVLWRLREALDPDQAGGSPIDLYPGQNVLADLAAVTFWDDHGKIVAESKEDVCKRLGRSTDEGDTVAMCWSVGPTATTDASQWEETRRKMGSYYKGNQPKVVMGRHHTRR